ncbi:MAG: lysophospholipid acyltransferase family protein [Nitrospirota bacterium]
MTDRLKYYLLNLYFYPLFLFFSAFVIPVLTIVITILGILVLPERQTWRRFRRAINWYGKIVMAIPFPFIRVQYEHSEKNDQDGPFIIVCNHRSAADAFLMGVLPYELVQIVNVWPFRLPVLGQYAKFAGYLNIRMMQYDQFITKASRLLEEGVSIVFFPEGTRSTDQTMRNFHSAAFRLAYAAKASIVPLCISGSDIIMPKGSALLRSGMVKIRQLPPIAWNDYKDLTVFAFKNRVWKIMDRELAMMENRA